MRTIQRRLHNLETELALALMPEYPPLTQIEIDSIKDRTRAGGPISRVEMHRLEKQSPIVDGEHMIVCHGGKLFVKHYIGIDMSVI